MKYAQGKLYLSPIKDLSNGEIITYDVSRCPNVEQITRMMKQAIAKLDRTTPILHLDKGWCYQMTIYRALLKQNDIRQSMAIKGNCLDNRSMKSFFWRLKTEGYFGKLFDIFAELEQTIHEYVHYYNHERIQVKLKGLGPVEYRTQFLNKICLTFGVMDKIVTKKWFKAL